MRNIVAFAAALFVSSFASAQPAHACEPVDPTVRIYGPELTIAQLEKIGLELVADNPTIPQVAFGMGNRNWERLKAQYTPGDVFKAFDGPRWSDGTPIAGGYILLRGSCVVGQIATWRA
ncbi:hypothetical protein [Lysobacter tyrosinilyticus]